MNEVYHNVASIEAKTRLQNSHGASRDSGLSGSVKIARRRASGCSVPARRLLDRIVEIIEDSADRSCYASLGTLAKSVSMRKATVHECKHELIKAGAIALSLRANGGRRNPRHRLSLPQPQRRTALRGPRVSAGCEYRPLYATDLWTNPLTDRLTLIELYTQSGWNVVPLEPYSKRPAPGCTKDFWSRLTTDQRLDVFYHDRDLGVGLWLDDRFEVFDLDDCDLEPPDNTLVAVRGNRAHVYFQSSGELYNLSGIAPGVDVRACSGLVVLPPTIHKSGDLYRWSNVTDPIPVPPDYMALWRNRRIEGESTGFRLTHLPEVIPVGQRENTIWSYGRSLRASGCDHDYIRSRLRYINLERCKPPLPTNEIEFKISHILTWRNSTDPRRWQDRKAARA